MHISTSLVKKKRTYKFNAPADLSTGLIVIEGNDIAIDFNGSILAGSNDKKLPNEFYGVGIFIKSGKNITIKMLLPKDLK